MVTLEDIDEVRKEGFRPNVVALIISKNRQVLLCYKDKYSIWEFCQGGIENNETLSEALEREIKEELGVNISKFTMGGNDAKPLMENQITFPPQSRNSRKLKDDKGQSVEMKGKHYYFYPLYLWSVEERRSFSCSNSEYDRIEWGGYEKLSQLNAENKQRGKRRVIQKVLDELKKQKIII